MVPDLSFVPEEQLQAWIVDQRWFASKSREVSQLHVLEAVELRAESPQIVLALLEAVFAAGTHETYQVPLGLRPASEGWTRARDLRGGRLDRLRRDGRPGRGPRAAAPHALGVRDHDGERHARLPLGVGRRASAGRWRCGPSGSSSPTPASCSARS